MAGSPEKLISHSEQPLTETQTNRNIGGFYLSKLLKSNVDQHDRTTSTEICNFISKKAGAAISPDFKNIFMLQYHHWFIYSNYSFMTQLFLGQNSFEHAGWENATATIELAHKSESPDRYTPTFLRIAKIDKEQGLIIAATYDLTQNNRLSKMDVSIPWQQVFYIKHSPCISKTLDETSQMIQTIPTSKNYPYETAGLITRTMWDKVNPEYPHKGYTNFSHLNTLTFEFDKDNPILDQLGYYRKAESGITVVGLEKATAEKMQLTPWEISVPARLQKI